MIKKLVASAVLLGVGYVVGAIFGFRAAVTDYVENDAQKIENLADDLYPDSSQEIPKEVRDVLEGAGEGKGFQ
jgi:hypothetical protein